MRCWCGYLSAIRCKWLAYCQAGATTSLPPHHLCFRKSQNGLSFWYRPTRVVLGQGWMLLLVSLVTWRWVLLQMFVGCLWELIAPGSVLCIVLRICKCDVECRKIRGDVTDSESDRIWHLSLQIRNPIDLQTYADLDSNFHCGKPTFITRCSLHFAMQK